MADVLVVYWSGTGNTEIMAEKVAEGIKEAGGSVDLRNVSDISPIEALEYEKIAFGCPSMGVEVLEEDEFEPFFEDIEEDLRDKKIALFGSYDWGNGEWMADWEQRVNDSGAELFEKGVICHLTPEAEQEDELVEFGQNFFKF